MILPRQAKAGTILRLKGKGIEESRKRGRGDQYVCIKILEADANAGLDGAIAS